MIEEFAKEQAYENCTLRDRIKDFRNQVKDIGQECEAFQQMLKNGS